jgi:hypothetical protein
MTIAVRNTIFYYTAELVQLKLPLALDIVPIALPFYLMGYYSKGSFLEEKYSPPMITLVSLICVCCLIAGDFFGYVTLPYTNMGLRKYGWPVVNLIIPLPFIVLVRNFAIALVSKRIPGAVAGSIGAASLMIMFFDRALPRLFLKAAAAVGPIPKHNIVLCAALGIALPWGLYQAFLRFGTTRKLFNGIWT